MKVSFNERPWDLDSLEALQFTESQLERPGPISVEEFQDYI